MAKQTVFTSESVSEGHPDKIADQISDAVLDAILTQDPESRVACETFIKNSLIIIGGEITTQAKEFDWDPLIRKLIYNIGYVEHPGFDSQSCSILTSLSKQSPDIARGVNSAHDREQGAGDQGIMFGYATNETDVLMPAPITYAHRLVQTQAKVRKNKQLPWLRPDAKSQISIRYENQKPIAIDAIVLSTQHEPDVTQGDLIEGVMEEIIKPTLPKEWLHKNTIYHINPTGRFVLGGPQADSGLTGRKIIVDTYGGMARHGGGAMSGKDASKVDRSGAYAARYVAKNIVAAGLADRCEIQISYAIGVAKPTSIYIETFGTGKISEEKLIQLIEQHFDLRPRGIIDMLSLLNPIYLPTATYGHFGRTEKNFTWEKTDKAEVLKNDANL